MSDEMTRLIRDEHLNAVFEFMQQNVPPGKLVAVAKSLPEIAQVLWEEIPTEPCLGLTAVDIVSLADGFVSPAASLPISKRGFDAIMKFARP